MQLHKTYKANFAGTIFEPLLQLTDCPAHMYWQGILPDPQTSKLITVVGSRAHSSYAKQALTSIIGGLSRQPVCVVSGLALGIDALAHNLALTNKLPTIAVPGSGLDSSVIYPATNQQLAHQILHADGCVISEFEPTDRAARWTFPKRNRIMAAMSDLVLIVEAADQSGTLITARNATEYDTTVAVIPHSIFSETAVGSNRLMQDGAYPILSADDILQLLGLTQVAAPEKVYDDVSEDEIKLLNILIEPMSRDELSDRLKIDTSSLSALLSLLEIKGHIKEELGQIYKV